DRYSSILGAHETGGEHVGAVHRRVIGYRVGDLRHAGIGLVDVEVLPEHAILRIRELPSPNGAPDWDAWPFWAAGIGLSTKPTSAIPFITNAFMRTPVSHDPAPPT